MPGWIEAVATALAFIAAVVASVFVSRTYRLELKREHDRDELKKSAQASLVAGWFGRVPIDLHTFDGREGKVRTRKSSAVGYFIRNASELPVYDVYVELQVKGRPFADRSHDVLPPASEPHGFALGAEDQAWYEQQLAAAGSESALKPRVTLEFRDVANIVWARMPDGRLERLGSRPSR